MKPREGEAENPPRNAGAERAEKPPCEAERWAQRGSAKPRASSATAKRRFMEDSLRLFRQVGLTIARGRSLSASGVAGVHGKSKDC